MEDGACICSRCMITLIDVYAVEIGKVKFLFVVGLIWDGAVLLSRLQDLVRIRSWQERVSIA